MNDTPFIHSDHLVWLVNHEPQQHLFEGNYRFKALTSGLTIHGGHMQPTQSLRTGRLVDRYVNLIVLFEGCLRFAINQHRFTIEAGETGKLILITPEQRSVFMRFLVAGEESVKLAINGIERWLDRSEANHYPNLFQQPVRIQALTPTLREQSQILMNQLMAEQPPVLGLDYGALKLLEGLWLTLKPHLDVSDDATSSTSEVGRDDFIKRLQAVYEPHLSATELAERLHLSQRTVQRRIQQYFGCTLHQWMQHEKMIFALTQLSQKQLNISEVAYLCGYQHVSSFTHAFRQYFDMTPAQVR